MSGLEAVGVVSSIVQIADLGARVVLKLCTFHHKVQQTESNIESLSKDVSMTCTILQHFGDHLKRDDQIQFYSQDAFKTAQEVLDECGRTFRVIESAIDKDLSTIALTKGKSPFSKLSRKAILVFKSPQLDILQTNLDRLKNTVLLMINGIAYASQLRKRETEMSKENQPALIEILMQQKRESDQKFERLVRAINDVMLNGSSTFVTSPVTINTVGVPSNVSPIASLAGNEPDSPALSARVMEQLSHLSEITDDQFNLVHHEIKRYSRAIKGILESIQDAEPLLAANRHGRIKQAVLDAHATELQMFTAEYGEKAGQFCTQLCQGPLFNQISGETLEGVSQQTQIIAVMITTSASEIDPMEDNMSIASEEESYAVKIPDTEPETDRLKEDISTNGKEKWGLVVSPSSESDNTLTPTDEGEMMYSLPGTIDPNPAETIDQAGEWELYNLGIHLDDFFDLKELLSSWTTLTADELVLMSNSHENDRHV